MDCKKIFLDNGLTILYYPMMNTHSVTIGLYVKAGAGYESKNMKGITHYLEHLHFRSLGEMKQEELYYCMESMGSTLRAVTFADYLRFTMKVVPERTLDCLTIFKHIIEVDEWTEEELEAEKKVVINQIMEKGDFVYVEDEVRKIVFFQTNLVDPICGSIDNVLKFGLEDVKSFKHKVFHADNIILCITGHIDEKLLQSVAEELENMQIRKKTENQWMNIPKCFHHRKPDIIFKNTSDNILDVNLSFDISGNEDKEQWSYILNCILGEGVGSHLQKQIREKKGYSSNIYSYIEQYEGFGVLHIRFSVEKRNFEICLKEVITVINRIKEHISSKDLEVSLPFFTINNVFLMDDSEHMNFHIAYNEFVLNRQFQYDYLKNEKSSIELLKSIARDIFKVQNMCVVVVGNSSRITKKKIKEITSTL